MKGHLKYRPDLRDCELEDRLVPAIPNLGPSSFVLTNGGYVLASAFPGTAIPALLAATSAPGIFSMQPGNGSVVPGLLLATPTSSVGGAGVTIVVGSGANDAGALSIQPVTRNTVAYDKPNTAPTADRVPRDLSPVLPAGQVYRGGVATGTSGRPAEQEADPGVGETLPIRRRNRLHRLAAAASGAPISSYEYRAP